MRTIVCVSLLAALLGACDKATEPVFSEGQQIVSILKLKSMCNAPAVIVRESIAVKGKVIANDQYGEFERMLLIGDEDGGLRIAADHPALWEQFPVGAQVTVLCNGLTLCDYGGSVLLGTTPGESGPGRIPQSELTRFLRVQDTGLAHPRPRPLAIADIKPFHTDLYICFDQVRFTAPGTWCDTDPETNRTVTTQHTIRDRAGDTFVVRVPGSCSYAKKHLPEGGCSLCGVIDCFNGSYTLRVVNYGFTAATPATAYP